MMPDAQIPALFVFMLLGRRMHGRNYRSIHVQLSKTVDPNFRRPYRLATLCTANRGGKVYLLFFNVPTATHKSQPCTFLNVNV